MMLAMRYTSFFVGVWAALWIALLVGCNTTNPPASPTPQAAGGQVLSAGANGDATYIAYVLAGDQGVSLVSGVSFAAGPPVPIAGAVVLAIPPEALLPVQGLLYERQGVRYGLVQVRGIFTPTATGVDVRGPVLSSIAVRELSVRQLSETPTTTEVVRVSGGLLASERSARFAERISAGGVPASQARVIRVAAPIRDTALLKVLTRPPAGSVSYGQVVIEGLWQGEVLTPLGIFPLQTGP